MLRVDPFDPGRQPSGRTPAPGRLGLVQAFVNSFWDLDAGGADVWAGIHGYRRWLADRGFASGTDAGEADRSRAVELREALRALARRHHDGPGDAPGDPPELLILDALARRAPVHLRFGAGSGGAQARHEAAGQGADAALALVLGVVAEAMADGTWSRMKACPGPHCGWVFYDGSRNRSRQWCSMELCGNRVKGREFRARQRQGAGATDALRRRS
jgi:predicted RNA-binding Zn ribbon-like protein